MVKPDKTNSPQQNNKSREKERAKDDPLSIRGFRSIFTLVAIALWAGLLSFVDLFANWAIEQSIFESSSIVPNIRWIIHGVIGLVLLLSLFLAQLLVKTPRLKIIFKFWSIATIITLAFIPAKILQVTDQQAAASLQIIVLLISVIVFYFIKARKETLETGKEKKNRSGLLGMAVLVAGAMSIPWILWGALGSIDDTLLYLVLGEIFAVFFVMVSYPYLFDKTLSPEREISLFDYILDGITVTLFLFILLTGLSQNGSQLIMGIMLPFSAWLIVGLVILANKSSDRAKVPVGLISGLALALPQLWFDADELSIITNSTNGETLTWATRSAYFSIGIMLFSVIILLFFFKSSMKLRVTKKANWLMSLLSVAAVVCVYLIWGRVGFFGDKIFIVMKDQADLSQVAQIDDLAARKQAVYSTLVSEADTTQADLRAQLTQWKLKFTPYYLVNGIETDTFSLYSMEIFKRGDVDRVLESPQLRPLPKQAEVQNSDPANQPSEMSWNLKMIGIDKVRQNLGITGKGIVIGQTDSGVDGYHSEVKPSYRGITGGDDYNWLDPWNGTIYPTDSEGHGTATLGLITGKNIGIAPDAQWIGCVNLARNLGNPAVYLNCMQFMLAPYPQNGNAFTDGDTTKGAMIVNNSWGCPQVEGCDAEIFKSAVNAMETAGIFMSVAAGNTGQYGCSTVTDPPAIYQDVFTAGSINQAGNISDFSSLGPVSVDGSGLVKPDILAPGENIVSAFPGNAYMQADGTSFSAPHVSGVVALMWSANPKLIGNVELTRKILEGTASPYTGTMPSCITSKATPNDAAGYGVLNAYAAVKAAMEVQ